MLISNISYDQTTMLHMAIAAASVAAGASIFALRWSQKRRRSDQKTSPSSIWGNSGATGTQVVSIYGRDGQDNERPSLYIVTGATSGLGLRTARHLASLPGATHVILGCRDVSSGGSAAEELDRSSSPNNRVECIRLDLASFASVKSFAAAAIERSERLGAPIRGLVNNAGVYSLPG
eukprot:CAMPEP_0172564570 /NCGR_PEP_ID=MMETSP1067-20121228/104974_1 /TAXON_ID=265564 ORGANISM="Thalassiosira punctigera, Strain Tpunct2005C2" /NCGR_SAMPLE_ID=MMETSP1067 /ASSEMBLY_ACC=CAM_ASM_000444 /LENGTH=176 /DNA_ID=CAMNT_0013355283 /DNA_START=31 /DNA_END=557 /DNA_ORIENTATION=+